MKRLAGQKRNGMSYALASAVLVTAVVLALLSGLGAADDRSSAPTSHIVMFRGSVKHPGAVAQEQAKRYGMKLTHVYRYAVKGYSAMVSEGDAEAIAAQSAVRYVQPDAPLEPQGEPAVQVKRTGAPANANFHLDGVDDYRVNAGIAVLDAGMDIKKAEEREINIVGRTDCTHPDPLHEGYEAPDPEDPNWNPDDRLNGPEEELPYGCLDGAGAPYEYQPQPGHGLGIARIGAKIDTGGVGIASGARPRVRRLPRPRKPRSRKPGIPTRARHLASDRRA